MAKIKYQRYVWCIDGRQCFYVSCVCVLFFGFYVFPCSMEEHGIGFFSILVTGSEIINGHAILPPPKIAEIPRKPFLILFEDVYNWCPKKSASVAQWAAGGGEESVKICPPPKKREERPEKGERRNCPKDVFPLDSNSHNTCFPPFFSVAATAEYLRRGDNGCSFGAVFLSGMP